MVTTISFVFSQLKSFIIRDFCCVISRSVIPCFVFGMTVMALGKNVEIMMMGITNMVS
jgi:hypothetical protein